VLLLGRQECPYAGGSIGRPVPSRSSSMKAIGHRKVTGKNISYKEFTNEKDQKNFTQLTVLRTYIQANFLCCVFRRFEKFVGSRQQTKKIVR